MKNVFFIFLLYPFASIKSQGKIKIKTEINKSVAAQKKDLDIKLTITNLDNRPYLLYKPEFDGYPFLDNPKSYFEIQSMKNKEFLAIPENDNWWASVMPVPLIDSLGKIIDRDPDTLRRGHQYLLNINPCNIYTFTKGKYRVRFVIQIFKISAQAYKYIKSDWITFEVTPELIEPF